MDLSQEKWSISIGKRENRAKVSKAAWDETKR